MDPSAYPRLRGGRRGRGGPSAQEVAGSQRARLAAAMIAAVFEHGYEGLTVRGLEERSGVTKRDIYRHYKGGVHECFMAVFEQMTDALIERLADAWCSGDEPHEQLMLAVVAFMETIASEPAAASLALLEPFAAGARAVAAAQAAWERLAGLLAAGLEAHEIRSSPVVLRALLAGLGSVARTRLFAGREHELPGQARELGEWACCCLYAPEPGRQRVEGVRFCYRPSAALLAKAGVRAESARIRILAATAALAAEHGYAGIDERAIRERAQVTCEQFREQFACEHAAFVGVLESMWARSLRHATEVGLAGPDWPRGFSRGITALMGCLAEDPFFARWALTETSSVGGRAGARERTRLTSAAARQFRASAPAHMRPSLPAAEASVAAGWAIALHEIAQGEHRSLAAAAPTISFIGIALAIGPERAAEAIGATPARRRPTSVGAAQRPAAS